MGRLKKGLVCAILLGLMVGCTRDVGETSKFTLSFSDPGEVSEKAGALAQRTTFIAINVSSPSFRQVRVWDRHDERRRLCPTGCLNEPTIAPQTNFTFNEVPNGPVLVQVLRIREEISASGEDGDEIFQYTQRELNLTGGDLPVTISGFETHDGSSGKEGSVHGRYRLPNGQLFTGEMALMFDPGQGREPMEIFREEMFAGWFNMFLFENIKLRYIHPESGHVFFGQSLTTNSAPFTAIGNSVFRFETPKTFRSCNDCGDREEDSEIHIVGFWKGGGTPDNAGTVCHDGTAYESNSSFVDENFTTAAKWPNDFITTGGAGQCSMEEPSVTATKITIDGELIDRSGGDQLNFRGPYRSFKLGGSGPETVNTTYSGTDLTVNWRYLPGVLGSEGVAGSTVFFKKNVEDFFEFEGGGASKTECKDLLTAGFQTVTATGSQESVIIKNVSQTDLQDMEVILCPRRADGTFFRTAVSAHCLGGCGGGGPSGNNGSFQELKLVSALGEEGVSTNITGASTCHAMRIEVRENGAPVPADTNILVNLSHTQGPGSSHLFYDTAADCAAFPSGSTINTVTIPQGASSVDVFYAADQLGYQFIRAERSGGGPGSEHEIVYAATSPPPTLVLTHMDDTNLAINGCYSVLVKFINGNSDPAVVGGPQTVNLATSNGSPNALAGEFYAAKDCSGPQINSFSMLGNEAVREVFFRPNIEPVSGGQIDPTTGGMSPSPITGINVGTANVDALELHSHGPQHIFANDGSCMDMGVEPVNELDAKVTALSSFSLDLSATTNLGVGVGIDFYSDGSCSGSPITSKTFPAGSDHENINFRITSPNVDMLTVTAKKDGLAPTAGDYEFRLPDSPATPFGSDFQSAPFIPLALSFSDNNSFSFYDGHSNQCDIANTPPVTHAHLTLNSSFTANGSGPQGMFIRADRLTFVSNPTIDVNGDPGSPGSGPTGGLGASAFSGSASSGGAGGDAADGNGSPGQLNDGSPGVDGCFGFAFDNGGDGGNGGNGDGAGIGGGGNTGITHVGKGGGGGAASSASEGGGGGGGGGGLIVIVANEITGTAILEARGGDGGDATGANAGDGGGGGGGNIWIATRHYDGGISIGAGPPGINTGVDGGLPGSAGNPGISGNPGSARIFQIMPDNTLVEKAFNLSW